MDRGPGPARSPRPTGAIAGHKKPGAPDTPAAVEATKRYLADFGRLKETAGSDEELFDKMTELYPGLG